MNNATKQTLHFDHNVATVKALDPETPTHYLQVVHDQDAYRMRGGFVDAVANMFTLTNMGMEFTGDERWEDFVEGEDGGEAHMCLQREYDAWSRVAEGMKAHAVEHQLPLTLATAEACWADRGTLGKRLNKLWASKPRKSKRAPKASK